MDQSLPNYNPANMESPSGIMSELLADFARRFESCLPAVVVSYDRTKHEAVVQPAINMLLTTGEQVERANVNVTVWRMMLGGYLIDLPLSKGDTGWLIASDRDTSNFKESSTPEPPNTRETHKYTAGFFIPDSFGSFTIAAEDDGNMVFQNEAGTEKISIGASATKITSAALTISCPNATFTGNIIAGGDISTPTGDVSAGVITLKTHRTSGVSVGLGTSGAPVV